MKVPEILGGRNAVAECLSLDPDKLTAGGDSDLVAGQGGDLNVGITTEDAPQESPVQVRS